ncbi:MAG: trigger factor [Desulfovibrio sp.]|jgi:trigger factor|nr:trigger factor [Desulfovibrio sp.]
MQYSVEDLSPVKKKITITVPADEVRAALDKNLEAYRASATLKGFRRGKAPAAMVAKHFHQEIFGETATELIDGNLRTVLRENSFIPASRFFVSGEDLVRDAAFSCSVTFDVLPEFNLPPHEGLEVEQEAAAVGEEEIAAALERLRERHAFVRPVAEDRLPADGDVALLDFDGIDDSGEPLPEVSGRNLEISLGGGQTVPGFAELIKTLRPGETGQGSVTFPETYFHKKLAGKTISMRVRLISLSARLLPELDDAFARDLGSFPSLAGLREAVRDSLLTKRTEENRKAAKEKLLRSLTDAVDFPLPEALLEYHIYLAVEKMRRQMEQLGQNLDAADKSAQDALREEALPLARRRAKEEILLMAVAREHGLGISDAEADLRLRHMAPQKESVKQAVKDNMLQQKALDWIYERAAVTLTGRDPEEVSSGTSAAEGGEEEAAAGGLCRP